MEWKQEGTVKNVSTGKGADYLTIVPMNYSNKFSIASQSCFWLTIAAILASQYIPMVKWVAFAALAGIIVFAWMDKRNSKNWFLNEQVGIPKDHSLIKGDTVNVILVIEKKQ